MQQFFEGAAKQHLYFDSVGFHHYRPPVPDDFINLLEKFSGCTDCLSGDGICRRRLAGQKGRAGEPIFRNTDGSLHSSGLPVHGTGSVECVAMHGPIGDPGEGGPLSVSGFFKKDGTLTEIGKAYASA